MTLKLAGKPQPDADAIIEAAAKLSRAGGKPKSWVMSRRDAVALFGEEYVAAHGEPFKLDEYDRLAAAVLADKPDAPIADQLREAMRRCKGHLNPALVRDALTGHRTT